MIKQARKEFGCERTYAPGGGGESWDDVKRRATQFSDRLCEDIVCGNDASEIRQVLVFTSGGFIKEFINAEIYKSLNKFYPNNSKNCAIFKFKLTLNMQTKHRSVSIISLNQIPDGMKQLSSRLFFNQNSNAKPSNE